MWGAGGRRRLKSILSGRVAGRGDRGPAAARPPPPPRQRGRPSRAALPPRSPQRPAYLRRERGRRGRPLGPGRLRRPRARTRGHPLPAPRSRYPAAARPTARDASGRRAGAPPVPTPRCAPRGRKDYNSHNAARPGGAGRGARGLGPGPQRGSSLVVRVVTRGPNCAARSGGLFGSGRDPGQQDSPPAGSAARLHSFGPRSSAPLRPLLLLFLSSAPLSGSLSLFLLLFLLSFSFTFSPSSFLSLPPALTSFFLYRWVQPTLRRPLGHLE